jgi:hypothetical protein
VEDDVFVTTDRDRVALNDWKIEEEGMNESINQSIIMIYYSS